LSNLEGGKIYILNIASQSNQVAAFSMAPPPRKVCVSEGRSIRPCLKKQSSTARPSTLYHTHPTFWYSRARAPALEIWKLEDWLFADVIFCAAKGRPTRILSAGLGKRRIEMRGIGHKWIGR